MNFSYEKFLKPLVPGEKTIRVYDNTETLKYILNPFVVNTVYVRNNILYVSLDSSKSTLDFSNANEANLAAKKLQNYIDSIKNSNVPSWIQQAVELEAQYYTKGPTGSTGSFGPQGDQGPQGVPGYSSYDIWVQSGNTGTVQQYLDSIKGPIGPTGPMAFGDTDKLLVTGQTIQATLDGEDIELVTKGSGNLLFKIDRDGWLVNYGITGNSSAEIWSSGVTLDTAGNVYVTGGDLNSFYTWVTKFAPNGNVLWQRQLDRYSTGESIVFANNHLYILMSDLDDVSLAGNILIAKMSTSGSLVSLWSFDDNSGYIPEGFSITVDELDNVYYTGMQYNDASNLYDIIIGKLNTNTTTIEWLKVVDGSAGSDDRGYVIKYKGDHIYVAGRLGNYGNSFDLRTDIFVAKFDKDGTKVWAKVIGDSVMFYEALSMTVEDDGSVFLSGSRLNSDGSPTGTYNNFYIKLNPLGQLEWSKALDGLDRTIVDIETDGDGVFAISTQSTSSTPPRTSTDLLLMKISKSTGSIIWQQYIGTNNRDSVWANIIELQYFLPVGRGHKVMIADEAGKSVYVAGLTKEGNAPFNNAFLLSYDQKSLPSGTYSNWKIDNANFNTIDINNLYNRETTNVAGIFIDTQLSNASGHSVTEIITSTFSSLGLDDTITLLSPNTELYVKGIINIDGNYTFPRSAGEKGQVLTYVNDTKVLGWREQSLTVTFNDYEEIFYREVGTYSMAIHVDPLNGPSSGHFDDTYFTIALPFDINYMGSTYDTVYVGSNSLITFGSGVGSAGLGFTYKNPPYPGIFIAAADRSLNKLYTRATSDQFNIRFEGGTSSTTSSGLIWETTFNSNSGMIDVTIVQNDSINPGFTCFKDASLITKQFLADAGKTIRIYKGYGQNTTTANRIFLNNISGVSYSIVPDPIAPEQSFVSINLDLDGVNSGFTSFGTTGSNVSINSVSSWTFHAGIELGMDEHIYTKEIYSGDQGLYMQVVLPVLSMDGDRMRLGLFKSSGDWSASVVLVNNIGSTGDLIVYDTIGNAITYSQTYSEGDVLTIFSDGQTVYFKINGITQQTCPFVTLPTDTYVFRAQTSVQPINGQLIFSTDYTFTDFKFYPTGGVIPQNSRIASTTNNVTTSTFDYDLSDSSIWYHNSVSNDYTANFVNVPTIDNRVVTVNVIISQSSVAYAPTTIQINGNTYPVKWKDGLSSGNVNKVDSFEFNFIRSGGSWVQVLGDVKKYG
jgi:hypothetical protein